MPILVLEAFSQTLSQEISLASPIHRQNSLICRAFPLLPALLCTACYQHPCSIAYAPSSRTFSNRSRSPVSTICHLRHSVSLFPILNKKPLEKPYIRHLPHQSMARLRSSHPSILRRYFET